MRKTKIVCTLGPSTDAPDVLENLMLSGMDVARLNFSHGSHPEHLKRIEMVKEMRARLGRPVSLLMDSRGPEVRIGELEGGSALLEKGGIVTLTCQKVIGNKDLLPFSYADLCYDLRLGQKILIDDGKIELVCIEKQEGDIRCRVVTGGVVKNRKSINVPDLHLNMPYLSESDKADYLFAVQNQMDFVAASFVSTAADVLEVRRYLNENGGEKIFIISKIENREGVDNIDDILAVSDGIMVARGDLGVEIPYEELPRIQKILIKKCYRAGKMVITATQMLESMIASPRPTRAEASDVANAVYDGTSAVMLSGETAAGMYPLESVRAMHTICLTTEAHIHYTKRFDEIDARELTGSITDAISHATCTTAHDLNAAAIITVTKSGKTARMISKFRPACPIIGCVTDDYAFTQLPLSWGVVPVRAQEKNTTDDLFAHAVDLAKSTGLIKAGDIVVLTAGIPLGKFSETNILKIEVVQ